MNKEIQVQRFHVPAVQRLAGAVFLGLLLAVPAGRAAPDKPARNLSLADCVGLALENNLDLQIEAITRTVAREEVAAAKGGYDPDLTLSAKRNHAETTGQSAGTAAGALETVGSETDSDTYEAAVGGATGLGGLSYEVGTKLGDSDGTRSGNPFDTSTGSAGITLTQPLLQGFKTDATRYQVTIARKQSAEAAVQLEAKMQDILGQVEAAWYNLLQAHESILVQEEAVRLATQLYEDNSRKVQIGAMSILDEKQAESQAAAARADLSSAKQAYAEAQNQLKTLIFADHRKYQDVDIAPVGELSSGPVAVDSAASGERALEQRPDLRQERLVLERQGIVVDYQRNQTLPALDLVGGAGVTASDERNTGDVFNQLESADEPYWSAGVTLTFPLGNRAAEARHAQSVATAAKLKLQLRQLEEQALVEVDNAAAAVATGYERVQATRESRQYAQQALEAEQRKLENGKSTSFVVLQLQRDLTSARSTAIQALMEYNQQCAALAQAEGAMLERHHVEFTDPAGKDR